MRPQESWLTFPLKKKKNKNHVHCLWSYSSIQRHKSTLFFFSFGVIFIIVTGILLAIFHSINYVSLVNFFSCSFYSEDHISVSTSTLKFI